MQEVTLVWFGNMEILNIKSFESQKHKSISDIEKFLKLQKINLKGIEKIYVTGGKSRFFENKILDIPIIKVDEIFAIGRGGIYLYKKFVQKKLPEQILVASLGT